MLRLLPRRPVPEELHAIIEWTDGHPNEEVAAQRGVRTFHAGSTATKLLWTPRYGTTTPDPNDLGSPTYVTVAEHRLLCSLAETVSTYFLPHSTTTWGLPDPPLFTTYLVNTSQVSQQDHGKTLGEVVHERYHLVSTPPRDENQHRQFQTEDQELSFLRGFGGSLEQKTTAGHEADGPVPEDHSLPFIRVSCDHFTCCVGS